jgi:hypothetical protein
MLCMASSDPFGSRPKSSGAVIAAVSAALTIASLSACDRGYVEQTAAELRRENQELRNEIEKLQFRVYQLERETGLDGTSELTPEDLERRRQECVEERGEDSMMCMSLP